MSISLDRDQGLVAEDGAQIVLDCPYCNVHAHMSPRAVPGAAELLRDKPAHVGLVFQCDACKEPVFLRFTVRHYGDDRVELYRNFTELERPKERFSFSYLPDAVALLFREALECYSHNSFNAFASMCRRSAVEAFEALGKEGKMRAFDEVMIAQDIAGVDDDAFAPIKSVLFDEDEELPMISRAQAGILLEIQKDMFYQCFVRHGKLSRAIKVRRFFVEESDAEMQSTA